MVEIRRLVEAALRAARAVRDSIFWASYSDVD